MQFFPEKMLRAAAFLLLLPVFTVFSAEMPTSLREADRLYQVGRYDQAIALATKFIEFSPQNLEATLIIGMSQFNQKNYPEAKAWFRRALKLKAKNLLAKQYLDLIQEIEHRQGPFSSNFTIAQSSDDRLEAGNAFKKGWFGHGFPKESPPTKKYFDPEKNLPAPIALEVPPPVEKILVEKSVAKMAKEAFTAKLFVKAYLFYSQLLSTSPGNRTYLLGKAESAFELERFEEVVKILGPIMLFQQEKSFSPDELKLANNLLNQARLKINSLR